MFPPHPPAPLPAPLPAAAPLPPIGSLQWPPLAPPSPPALQCTVAWYSVAEFTSASTINYKIMADNGYDSGSSTALPYDPLFVDINAGGVFTFLV